MRSPSTHVSCALSKTRSWQAMRKLATLAPVGTTRVVTSETTRPTAVITVVLTLMSVPFVVSSVGVHDAGDSASRSVPTAELWTSAWAVDRPPANGGLWARVVGVVWYATHT